VSVRSLVHQFSRARSCPRHVVNFLADDMLMQTRPDRAAIRRQSKFLEVKSYFVNFLKKVVMSNRWNV